MAEIDPGSTVVDAGPLIHLDELDCLDLLSDFCPLVIPDKVWQETLRHRPHLALSCVPGSRIESAKCSASLRLSVMADVLGLAAAEIDALSLAESCRVRCFLTDDSAARLAGEALGLRVHGSIGVLVRSIRTGKRSKDKVLSVLKNVSDQSTLHISRRLLAEVIEKVSQG